MKSLSLFLLLTIIFQLSTQAQDNVRDKGALPFLTIIPDARSSALGGCGVAIPEDAFTVFHNAAKGLQMQQNILSYGYVPRLTDITEKIGLSAVGYIHSLPSGQAIVAGCRYLHYDSFELYDNSGNSTGTFKPKEFSLELGYTRLLTEGLSASSVIHYIHSDLGSGFEDSKAGHTVAFDLGLFYHQAIGWLAKKASWNLGLNLSNFGPGISYGDKKYTLPGGLQLGTALDLPFHEKHRLVCALEAGRQILPANDFKFDDITWSIGTEYWFHETVALRAGYHYEAKKWSTNRHLSLGAGIRWHYLQADAAYIASAAQGDTQKNTFRFSIGLNLGIFKRNHI